MKNIEDIKTRLKQSYQALTSRHDFYFRKSYTEDVKFLISRLEELQIKVNGLERDKKTLFDENTTLELRIKALLSYDSPKEEDKEEDDYDFDDSFTSCNDDEDGSVF